MRSRVFSFENIGWTKEKGAPPHVRGVPPREPRTGFQEVFLLRNLVPLFWNRTNAHICINTVFFFASDVVVYGFLAYFLAYFFFS